MAPSWYQAKLEEIESPTPARQFSLAAGVAVGESTGDDVSSVVSLDLLTPDCEDAAVLREQLRRRTQRLARLRRRYHGVKQSRGTELRRRVDLESKLDSAKHLLRKARCELENAKKELAAARKEAADAHEELKGVKLIFTNFPSCVVCWQGPREIAFFPCGHTCCCHDCAARLQDESPTLHCPLCRERVEVYYRLYDA